MTLSLTHSEFLAIHEKREHATPANLTQSYVVCDLAQKLSVCWSFIKSHLHSKTLVFMSSCQQVNFVFRLFSKMQPGISIMCLHGRMKQMKRLAVYNDFVDREEAVLLATDIAARGLDFSALDWVS